MATQGGRGRGCGLARRWCVVVGMLLALLPMMPAMTTRVTAAGQTYVVTSTAYDPNEMSTSNCTVASCTLQQAILTSNANPPGAGDRNTITFNIPTTDPGYDATIGVFTIKPSGLLPGITVPTLLDGYSQPGARANTLATSTDAILKIEIDGSTQPPFCCIGWGILVTDGTGGNSGSGSTVRGLVVNRVPGSGIIVKRVTGVTIAGNYIGTTTTGLVRAVNQNIGIEFSTEGVTTSTIGGTTPADRNVIASAACGMSISGVASTGNVVRGNFSGLKADGSAPLDTAAGDPVGKSIQLVQGTTGNTIGGLTPGARNVFAGDILGLVIGNTGTSGNVVQGNYFGIKPSGTTPSDPPSYVAPNNIKGIQIEDGATNNTIGGTVAGASNVVSGLNKGVVIISANTSGNVVQGNFIGTNAAGTGAIANVAAGVLMQESASGNTIGGTAPGAGNLIAYNTGKGVIVGSDGTDTASTGNRILGNRVFANAEPGIDLAGDGITANASGTRTGPNHLQNYPVLATASGTFVTGTLNSTANASFRIELFTNATAVRQGQTLVGNATATTDGNGNATFTAAVSALVAGQFVTATATNTATGDTSEFAAPLAITGGTVSPTITDIGPSSGDLRGGALVTITGTGFVAGQTSVQFGGDDATVQSVTATGIRVLTPAHAPGIVSVSVTVGGQTATRPNAYTYGAVAAAPALHLTAPPTMGTPAAGMPTRPTSTLAAGSPTPLPAPSRR